MSRQSLVEYLIEFERHGEGIALVHQRGYRKERWSWPRTAASAWRFARELESRGIHPGDRVVLWGSNCAEWVAAFWGCLAAGVVAVPLDYGSTPEFVLKVIREVEARLLVCSLELRAPQIDTPTLRFESLNETIAAHSPALLPLRGDAIDQPAEIIFTSGTTSEPRGVVLTHRNLLANLEPLEVEIRRYLKYERPFHPLRFLCLVPLSHVFGQFMGLLVPPIMGATVIFQQEPGAAEIIRTVKSERVSVLAAVPRILQSLKRGLEQEMDFRGGLPRFQLQLKRAEGRHVLRRWWRFRDIHSRFGWKFWAFVCGGAALDKETEAFWSRLGYLVVQGYGLTETASLISLNHPMRVGQGSIGKALPGREIRLAENGEIQVRGENVAAGYWVGKTIIPLKAANGWYSTGDIGSTDEQGNLYFRGRSKNVIVTPEGMNIYPEDLERTLKSQPGVRDCVVAGIHRDGNAEPCAVLILTDPQWEPDPIIRAANASLAGHQQIRLWCLWPEADFPRTPTHKPRLQEIQNYAQARFSGSAAPTRADGELQEILQRITGRNLPGAASATRLTEDLNLSSLERVELITTLEQRFRVELDESRVTPATTLAEIEQMLAQPAAAREEFAFPEWPLNPLARWIRTAIFYLLCLPAMRLLCWPRISGREQLHSLPEGPVLIVCNHVTSLDVGFVQAALPARLRHRLAVAVEGERLQAMRRPPLDTGWLGRLSLQCQYFLVVALFNAFPLPQGSGFRRSFAFAGQAMDRGYHLMVFPEGQLTRTGRMVPFRNGIGLLAVHLNVPVIPMRIDGLFELKQAGRRAAAPGRVRVTIGKPAVFAAGADPASITRELQQCVEALAATEVPRIKASESR